MRTVHSEERGPGLGRHRLRGCPGWIAVFALAAILISCKTATDPEADGALTIHLDAVPLLLKAADTLDVATVWATVLQSGRPVPDSTRVSFAATNGRIGSEALTQDGLARVEFRPGLSVGVAAIIAQVRAVRDTVLITLY